MLQYIGARYVPIFYQNSLDPTSSEWEANVTYEPLTWVSLPNGYMYISKKEVPANTGTPASNPDYWLEAGQYNAYIQNLQDQIDNITTVDLVNIQNQINTINNTNIPAVYTEMSDRVSTTGLVRKAIVIGDSWAKGYTGVGQPEHSFTVQLGNMNIFDELYVSATLDAPGFINGTTFATQFAAISALHDDITDVIIEGGVNDNYMSNLAAIKTAATSLFNTIKTTYPQANLYYFPNLGIPSNYITSQAGPLNRIQDLMRLLTRQGVKCSLAPYLSVAFDFDFWITDNLHLNDTGYDTFGVNVGNICTNNAPIVYPMHNSNGQPIYFTETFVENSMTISYVASIDTYGNVQLHLARSSGTNTSYQLNANIAKLFPRNMAMDNNQMKNCFCLKDQHGLSPSIDTVKAALIKTSDLYFFIADDNVHHILEFNIFEVNPKVNYYAFDTYVP